MGRMGEAEKIKPGFLDAIAGKKGFLTVSRFSDLPIFPNDYIGVDTPAAVYTRVTRIYVSASRSG